MSPSRTSLLAAGLFAAASVMAQTGPAEALRAEFLLAYERARATGTSAAEDSPELRAYALYPYLEAARLGSDLDKSDDWSSADDAMQDFLERHGDDPVTVNARIRWLESFAERSLWQPFLDAYRENLAGTRLRCLHLSARISVNDVAGIEPLIESIWLTAQQLPPACETVFQWLRDSGGLDDELTASRVRLLLENGQSAFARIIARRLPAERQRPLLYWADLLDHPLSSIEAHIERLRAGGNPSDIAPDMLLNGWSRLARDAPSAALDLFEPLLETAGFDQTTADRFSLALALGLAWDRRVEALEHFQRVGADGLDDYALGWQARAALWNEDWALVRSAVAAMSKAEQETSEWIYWAARASEDDAERDRLLSLLLPRDNYFSALAAATLRQRATTHPQTHDRDTDALAAIASIPAIQRAGELWRTGLAIAAAREWQYGLATLDAAQRAQSVHLASDLGWLDLAVATATESGIFFDYELLYPRPYTAEVRAAADEFDLDPNLILAVMRQESLYRADADSAAGARGLMQITAGTAADIARELEGLDSGPVDLLDPAVNIRIGSARLSQLLDRYDDNLALALAAYNAGPAAAQRWLPDRPIDTDIWLANVPFNETRDYVRRVLWNTVVFETLDDRRSNTRRWLDEIAPP